MDSLPSHPYTRPSLLPSTPLPSPSPAGTYTRPPARTGRQARTLRYTGERRLVCGCSARYGGEEAPPRAPAHTHAHTHTQARTHPRTHTHTHTHAQAHTHKHAHTPTHPHPHPHTRIYSHDIAGNQHRRDGSAPERRRRGRGEEGWRESELEGEGKREREGGREREI